MTDFILNGGAEDKWGVMNHRDYCALPAPMPGKPALPAGVYEVRHSDKFGWFFSKRKVSMDGLIQTSDGPSHQVMAEAERFWQLRDAFKKRKLLFKRGILMHGAPGSGKTVTINQVMNMTVNKLDGIVIMGEGPMQVKCGLKLVRDLEPTRPVMVILEDLDDLIQDDESSWLAILDSQDSTDNVIFLATTNYLDKLPSRLMNRPSRFDLVIEVGAPSASLRREYFKAKERGLSEDELAAWVAGSEGLSIAHLRELIILVKCYEMPLETALARLQGMKLPVIAAQAANVSVGDNTMSPFIDAAVEAIAEAVAVAEAA